MKGKLLKTVAICAYCGMIENERFNSQTLHGRFYGQIAILAYVKCRDQWECQACREYLGQKVPVEGRPCWYFAEPQLDLEFVSERQRSRRSR